MIARIPPSHGAVTLEMVSAANPGWKIELDADGSILMSPTGTVSGARDMALSNILYEWKRVNGGEIFGSSTGFTMPDGAVLSPDAAWISAARWSTVSFETREEYADIVPDVCIEVASKTDRASTLIAKLQRFLGYGAGYVLLIDPYNRTTWSGGVKPTGFPTDFTSVFDAGMT